MDVLSLLRAGTELADFTTGGKVHRWVSGQPGVNWTGYPSFASFRAILYVSSMARAIRGALERDMP
jgi:hypothetical protein